MKKVFAASGEEMKVLETKVVDGIQMIAFQPVYSDFFNENTVFTKVNRKTPCFS